MSIFSVYAVMGVLTGFNDEKPSKVSVTGSTDKDSGVDDKVEMQMEFSDGRIGIAKTSALEQVSFIMFFCRLYSFSMTRFVQSRLSKEKLFFLISGAATRLKYIETTSQMMSKS